MRRKQVALTVLLLLSFWSLVACVAGAQYIRPRSGNLPGAIGSRGGDARPNIVIILADDLGYSDVSCFGGEILTPNIDELAKDGLRLTQFYNAGRGCPSRAALLTGLYPHQTGIGHMLVDFRRPAYRGKLNRQCATIGQLLTEAGYLTMMAGKWHLSRFTSPEGPSHNWPVQRGFEEFYGTIAGAGSYFDPVTLCRGNQFQRETRGDFYYTDWIARRAEELVAKGARDDRPFFLFVSFTAPHWPLHAPAEAIARQRGKYSLGWDAARQKRFRRMQTLGIIKPGWKLSPRDPRVGDWDLNPLKPWQQRRMEVYAAQVDLLDRGVGRVTDALRQMGVERNTLVVFLSDNGASDEEANPDWSGKFIPEQTRGGRNVQVGNHPNYIPGSEDTYQSYGMAWANVSNTPWRMYKRYAHEGGIATPMIVRWPAVISDGGGRVDEVGHVIDLMPTCLDVARFRYPKQFEGYELTPPAGRSLMPIFENQERSPAPLFWEHEGNRAVRDGKWKLVALKGRDWELYDMEKDRTETNNLAKQFPAIVQSLSRAYNAWAERCGVLPWRR